MYYKMKKINEMGKRKARIFLNALENIINSEIKIHVCFTFSMYTCV